LARAFGARGSDPELAAELFSSAGSGPTLERARLLAWFQLLERNNAGSRLWLEFLEAHPTDELTGRAALELATALSSEGDREGSIAALLDAPESVRHPADLQLLEIADEASASQAARRLALDAPHLLRNHSRVLEIAVLKGFNSEDWISRASSWRELGLGSRGAAELRGERFRGDEEMARRKELARCELEAGSSSRTLNALPSRKNSDAEELVLRAEAYRRQGWGRFPDKMARTSFVTCLDEATQAAPLDATIREQALVLILECGTEAGQLEQGLGAWRELEASGWNHRRRGWLGRRLGIAIARSGADPRDLRGLESALPQHARCLRFWQALPRTDTAALEELASAPVSDLYGRWASDLVSADDGDLYRPPRPIGAADPASTVAWLLDNAGPSEAADEWQRLFHMRRPTRSEALAAAELAAHTGRANTAIRILRSGFPNISTTAIAEIPVDVALAYLPLRYADHLMTAAHETGLDPWLIAALARQESTFIAHAHSPAGARGVLQLLPSTARLHSRALGFGHRPDLENPEVNIRIGARELATLIRKYGALEPALAAYNAGERRVRRWWRRWPNAATFSESVPIPETYTYIRRVVFLSDAYRQIHASAWKEKP